MGIFWVVWLLLLFFCYLLVYWGFKQIYKTTIKPKVIKDKELEREIESLKQRVELFERKLDNK